jgi:hypothetical protein
MCWMLGKRGGASRILLMPPGKGEVVLWCGVVVMLDGTAVDIPSKLFTHTNIHHIQFPPRLPRPQRDFRGRLRVLVGPDVRPHVRPGIRLLPGRRGECFCDCVCVCIVDSSLTTYSHLHHIPSNYLSSITHIAAHSLSANSLSLSTLTSEPFCLTLPTPAYQPGVC